MPCAAILAMRSHLVEFGIVLLDALPASSKTIFI